MIVEYAKKLPANTRDKLLRKIAKKNSYIKTLDDAFRQALDINRETSFVEAATAKYNFFPTESSGLAPFFLMLGREAAVKHTLLESENPKYLGTDDGMINVGLMTKLYHVVAHNLNEARKARDGNKKGKTPKEPEKL